MSEKAVFVSVFRKYCTYAGKVKVQFENSRFETSDQATIEFLRKGNDKNITELTKPAPVKPVEPVPAPAPAPAPAPVKAKAEK